MPRSSKKSAASATGGMLHHLAFDHSFQAQLISNFNTGNIIAVNSTACKLFGYSKRELLVKNKADIFNTTEKSFKKMFQQIKEKGRVHVVITAVKKNGKSFPCQITASVFRNEHNIKNVIASLSDLSSRQLEQRKIDTKKEKIVAGNITTANNRQKIIDIKKEKIVAKDIVLALKKSDARHAVNSEWIKYIAKASYDVMWDWDIPLGEIYVGESVEEVFGYKVDHNKISFEDFCSTLLPSKKKSLEKKIMNFLSSHKKDWSDSFIIKRKDGSLATTVCRASIVRNSKGIATRMIGAIHDLSRQKELEEKLDREIASGGKLVDQYKDSFKFLFNSSADVFYDSDLVANEVIMSDAYEKEFGYKITGNLMPVTDWLSHVHPDDKEELLQDYIRMLRSEEIEWTYSYRFLKADTSVVNIISNGIVLRNAGKAYRMIGYMQDSDKGKKLEDDLEYEIRLKGKQIADAMDEAKETERSDISKELHDNVNQLLGVSKLYLGMARRGGNESELYLSRSSEYTQKAIEAIRNLTKGLSTDTIRSLGLEVAIDSLSRDIMQTNPLKIFCTIKNLAEQKLSDKFKLNIFRILQEQLNNIVKHAAASKVFIRLWQNRQSVVLIVSDNGVGFDTVIKQKGIGLDNIKSRAETYRGTANFVSQPGSGCTLTARFPLASATIAADEKIPSTTV